MHVYIFNAAATNVDRAGFGQGTGLPIVIDDVRCTLRESRLIDCPARLGSHNCNHGEDAGVICVPAYTPGPGRTELHSNHYLRVTIICTYMFL